VRTSGRDQEPYANPTIRLRRYRRYLSESTLRIRIDYDNESTADRVVALHAKCHPFGRLIGSIQTGVAVDQFRRARGARRLSRRDGVFFITSTCVCFAIIVVPFPPLQRRSTTAPIAPNTHDSRLNEGKSLPSPVRTIRRIDGGGRSDQKVLMPSIAGRLKCSFRSPPSSLLA